MKAPLHELTEFFEALGNIHRIRIVQMLLAHKSLPYEVLRHKTGVSQPTLSHHLARLRRVRIVEMRRVKRRQVYTLSAQRFLIMLQQCMPVARKKNSRVRASFRPRAAAQASHTSPFWEFLFPPESRP